MTEKEIKQINRSAPSSEVPASQQQQIVETKLIIENKDFQIIKYACESNDKWYIPEVELVIEKKVWKTPNPANKLEGEISWYGASSGKEKEQLKKLIYFGECEVDYWKKKIKELKESPHDFTKDKEGQYETRLQRAKKGLEELKTLSVERIERNEKQLITIKGTLTSPIQLRGETTPEPYYYSFIKLKGQSIDLPVIFKLKDQDNQLTAPKLKKGSELELTGNYSNSDKNIRKSFTAYDYIIFKKCLGCQGKFASEKYAYCATCQMSKECSGCRDKFTCFITNILTKHA